MKKNIARYFRYENAVIDQRKEHLSPSGKYQLFVTPFTTGHNSWNYTQGLVGMKNFMDLTHSTIAEIQRNYSAFPFLFVEDHPKGDFLVCGEDYQGQTVIDLMTSQRRNDLSSGADKGHGFCWGSYRYDKASQILCVIGCHWACPYEYRFFDFSDPMEKGWPELRTDEIFYDDEWPTFEADGTIKCYQTDNKDQVVAIKTLRRDGLQLVIVDEWVDEKEQQRRKEHKEAEEKHEQWLKTLRTTDPLYLTMLELVAQAPFLPDAHDCIGFTYDGWAPNFDGREERICRRIGPADKQQISPTIDLEWGARTGPIKLVVYNKGNHKSDMFFEHSEAGMREAFSHARKLLS